MLNNTTWRFRPAIEAVLVSIIGPLDSVVMEFSNPNNFSVNSYLAGLATPEFKGFYGESGNTFFFTDTNNDLKWITLYANRYWKI